ncbi:hypothetical protein B566_EDAN013326 [Ephemera danica]|nr:hypothetical protein B566_EDAN013326 [Ephemera danica]
MPPNSLNDNNILEVWNNLYGGKGRYKKIKISNKNMKGNLKLGDKVRISREKFVFEKGFATNWSDEIFVVSKKVIIDSDHKFAIDKILKNKGKGASTLFLVRWRGYSDKFDSWISAKGVVTTVYEHFTIPKGYYGDTMYLIDRINEILLDHFYFIVLSNGALKIMFYDPKTTSKYYISKKLATMLGFSSKTLFVGTEVKSTHLPNIKRGLPQQLQIHTNNVKPQLVGGMIQNLLKIVPMHFQKDINGCHHGETVANPIYLPVSHEKFDILEMNIKDEFGVQVSFDHGISGVVLHFRVSLLKDALNGRPVKDSFRERFTEAGNSLISNAASKIEQMVGNGYKKSRKRKRTQSKRIVKRRMALNRPAKKRSTSTKNKRRVRIGAVRKRSSRYSEIFG